MRGVGWWWLERLFAVRLKLSWPSVDFTKSWWSWCRGTASILGMRLGGSAVSTLLAFLFGKKRVLLTFRGFLPECGCHRLSAIGRH